VKNLNSFRFINTLAFFDIQKKNKHDLLIKVNITGTKLERRHSMLKRSLTSVFYILLLWNLQFESKKIV